MPIFPQNQTATGTAEKDLVNYLKTVFDSEDLVCYVTESFEVDGKLMPGKAYGTGLPGELIEASTRTGSWRINR